MPVTRRNVAILGALAVGAAGLLGDPAAHADDAADETAVKDAVEALRKALLAKDKAQLEQLAAPELSYGHSSGKLQTKAGFVDGVMSRKATIKSLSFPDLAVTLSGDAANARHLYVSDSETDGKPNHSGSACWPSGKSRAAPGSCWRARPTS